MVGGALLYRQYKPSLRLGMKLFMALVGGPTDTSREHDLTDWTSLRQFTQELVGSVSESPASNKDANVTQSWPPTQDSATKPLVLRSIITWVAFVPIAIVNGMVRDRFYGPQVGELAAHQISTAAGSAAFLGFAYAMLRNIVGESKPSTALKVGACWVIATMSFEFWLGRLARRLTWHDLLDAYNVFRGRVWGLFLLVVFVAPSLTWWVEQLRADHATRVTEVAR